MVVCSKLLDELDVLLKSLSCGGEGPGGGGGGLTTLYAEGLEVSHRNLSDEKFGDKVMVNSAGEVPRGSDERKRKIVVL